MGQISLDALNRAVRKSSVVDEQFGQVSVRISPADVAVVREIVGPRIARGPKGQDGQTGRPVFIDSVGRTVFPKSSALYGSRGMAVVQDVVLAVAMEVIRVVLPEQEPVAPGIFDHPENGADVIDVVEAVIVTVGPVVAHDGQPVLGIGNKGWRTMPGGVITGA